MGLISFILRRPTPYKLRKDYDKLREKADKIHNIEERLGVLRALDQIEPSIISVEEHHMSHFEKKKTIDYAESILRKVKFMMGESKRAQKEKKDTENTGRRFS